MRCRRVRRVVESGNARKFSDCGVHEVIRIYIYVKCRENARRCVKIVCLGDFLFMV